MAFNPKDFLKKSPSKPADPDPQIGFDDSLPQTDPDTEPQTDPDIEPQTDSKTEPKSATKPAKPDPKPSATVSKNQLNPELSDKQEPSPSSPKDDSKPSSGTNPSTTSESPKSPQKDSLLIDSKQEPDPSTSTPPLSSLPLAQRVKFYGVPTRMIKLEDTWYFVLNDLLYILKVPSNTKYFEALSTKPELADQWNQLTQNITFLDNNSEITELCTDKEGLLTIMSYMDEKFPGPFTAWIDRVNQLKTVKLPQSSASPPYQSNVNPN